VNEIFDNVDFTDSNAEVTLDGSYEEAQQNPFDEAEVVSPEITRNPFDEVVHPREVSFEEIPSPFNEADVSSEKVPNPFDEAEQFQDLSFETVPNPFDKADSGNTIKTEINEFKEVDEATKFLIEDVVGDTLMNEVVVDNIESSQLDESKVDSNIDEGISTTELNNMNENQDVVETADSTVQNETQDEEIIVKEDEVAKITVEAPLPISPISSSIGREEERIPNRVIDTVVVRTMEIFENQRFSPIFGWSVASLLPTDRLTFSSRDGQSGFSTVAEVNDQMLSFGWSWESNSKWEINSFGECDDEGESTSH
jgi:hypothetical protein